LEAALNTVIVLLNALNPPLLTNSVLSSGLSSTTRESIPTPGMNGEPGTGVKVPLEAME
jgi:hypothetical protein